MLSLLPQHDQMAQLIVKGTSQHRAHEMVGLSGSRSAASKIVRSPAFQQRLEDLREDPSPASPAPSDRDAVLSMLAGLIAQAMDQEDEESTRVLFECYAKIIRDAASD